MLLHYKYLNFFIGEFSQHIQVTTAQFLSHVHSYPNILNTIRNVLKPNLADFLHFKRAYVWDTALSIYLKCK